MTVLVVGASGATGRRAVEQLLRRGLEVRIIVRSIDSLPPNFISDENLSVVEASISALSDVELARHASDCDMLVSCLGHNLSFAGIFGSPRRLVTDATRRLCDVAKANGRAKPVKFVLMNTTGNSNRDLNEKISFGQKVIIWLLRHLLPPHADNEDAAEYLRTKVGQNSPSIEWVAVRPDGLIDDVEVSHYETYPSPIRSAIFDAGSTSRINVGHFIADLITNDDTWKQWKGKMPVIYNAPLIDQ